MAFKDTVKEWFKTGLKPTQTQFYSKFDFLRWKDEKIPISDIEQIESILNAKAEAAVVTNHLNTADAHQALFNLKQNLAEKGEVNGYAPLNEFALIASQYLNIVNDLVTGGATALLSAEQGKVLQTQVNAINTLLTSDNVNLDTVQELVDAIETVQMSLSTILVNDLTTGGTTKALTAEMGKQMDLSGLHKTGDETKTGSLIIKALTVAFFKLFGTNQKAFEYFNDQNNLIASLRNGGASQGHWQFGTMSAYFEGRESGPQYLKASVPLEVPNATAFNHAVNKSQVDELTFMAVNLQAGITYTFQADDYKKITIFTSSNAVAVTVPTNSVTPFAVGTSLKFYVEGTGDVTVSGAGVTFTNNGLVFKKGDRITLIKTATDTWQVQTPRYRFMNSVLLSLNTGASTPSLTNSGDIFMKGGNLYIDGVSNGDGTGFSYGNTGTNTPGVGVHLRSLTGLGLDQAWGYFSSYNTNYLLSNLVDETKFGVTSLAYTGYHYFNPMLQNGVLDAHPDMHEGAVFTVKSMQLLFDIKGQIFTKGNSTGGSWKKFVNSDNAKSYTPALVNTLNVTSNTRTNAHYSRIGDLITVTIGVQITPTAANSNAQITIPLPVARTLTTVQNVGGAHITDGTTGEHYSGTVQVSAANTTEAVLFFKPKTINQHVGTITFTYSLT